MHTPVSSNTSHQRSARPLWHKLVRGPQGQTAAWQPCESNTSPQYYCLELFQFWQRRSQCGLRVPMGCNPRRRRRVPTHSSSVKCRPGKDRGATKLAPAVGSVALRSRGKSAAVGWWGRCNQDGIRRISHLTEHGTEQMPGRNGRTEVSCCLRAMLQSSALNMRLNRERWPVWRRFLFGEI